MANNSDKATVKVRVFVRISIPELDATKVPTLQADIQEIAKAYEGAEVEVSMSQPRPLPPR